jgi:phage-related protein
MGRDGLGLECLGRDDEHAPGYFGHGYFPRPLQAAQVALAQARVDRDGLTSVPHKVHSPYWRPHNGSMPVFFRLESGSEPVRGWLKSLRKDERKAIGEDIAYVQFKWPIGKPRVDHLRGSVWEVRTSLTKRIARTLFAVEGRQMVLLHAFIKKTQQTPNDDIKLAEKRFKEWQRGET